MQRFTLRHAIVGLALVGGMLSPAVETAHAVVRRAPIDVMPIKGRKRPARRATLRIQPIIAGNGIDYHGGVVMSAPTTNLYAIWYGDWPAQKRSILAVLLSSIGGSAWYGTNATYFDGNNARVQPAARLAGQTTDSYSHGRKSISDTSIKAVVVDAIRSGRLPSDPNGVYFVFTSKDVTKRGFMTSYCGWHTYTAVGETQIKYSFVGEPSGTRMGNCAPQSEKSPNGDPGVDAMANVTAHELAETVTDPLLNSWYDSTGAENADKCAWSFGTTFLARNGANANVRLGGREYLLQQNWVNKAGVGCALSA